MPRYDAGRCCRIDCGGNGLPNTGRPAVDFVPQRR
jgi:hypothetical protein